MKDASDLAAKYLTPGWQNEDAPYFEAVGKFITAYAKVEIVFFRLACRLLETNHDKAALIFSGMRFPDLIQRIQGMLALDQHLEERHGVIQSCLEQIKTIGDQRHRLVHRWVMYDDKKISATNLTAKSLNRLSTDVFTLTDLRNMKEDCSKIFNKILRISDPDDALSPAFEAWMNGPWQYESPPQAPQKPRSRRPKNKKTPR